jgi:hypothetical protein
MSDALAPAITRAARSRLDASHDARRGAIAAATATVAEDMPDRGGRVPAATSEIAERV